MNNTDQTKRESLANKYPQMEQHFQEVKKEAFEPQIERLGQTKRQQADQEGQTS